MQKEKNEKIIIYTDGGSRGNPGISGAGAVITDSGKNIISSKGKPLGQMTNNEAEYEGVLLGIDLAKKEFGKEKLKGLEIEFRLDSELLVKQLNGEYQIKKENLIPYFIKIWNARVVEIPRVKFVHIPREKNGEADKLANDAMDAQGQESLL